MLLQTKTVHLSQANIRIVTAIGLCLQAIVRNSYPSCQIAVQLWLIHIWNDCKIILPVDCDIVRISAKLASEITISTALLPPCHMFISNGWFSENGCQTASSHRIMSRVEMEEKHKPQFSRIPCEARMDFIGNGETHNCTSFA